MSRPNTTGRNAALERRVHKILPWFPLAAAVCTVVFVWFATEDGIQEERRLKEQRSAEAQQLCDVNRDAYFSYYRNGQSDTDFDLDTTRGILEDCVRKGRFRLGNEGSGPPG
jgi:hypothetical protein